MYFFNKAKIVRERMQMQEGSGQSGPHAMSENNGQADEIKEEDTYSRQQHGGRDFYHPAPTQEFPDQGGDDKWTNDH